MASSAWTSCVSGLRRLETRAHLGEGVVDLVPLLHPGLLDLHEHPPARGLGPSLGHLQLRDHGPAREHRVRGPGARGQRRAVCLLAVQDRRFKRNPITGVLYCELAEFRAIVREHCDDKDKYFLVDRIPETPADLGFEPDAPTPPADGYRAWMPWWKGQDRRHPSKRDAGLCS